MAGSRRHLLNHTAAYFLARGVPGAITFLSIPLFTRWLTPLDYGRFALVAASVNLANALGYQWLRLSMVRYMPSYRQNVTGLKSTLLATWCAITLALACVGLLLLAVPSFRDNRAAVIACWASLTLQSLFELCCEQARATLRPWSFMGLQLCRSFAMVGLGMAAILLLKATWWGPLAGAGAGMLVAIAYCFGRGDWRASFKVDASVLRTLATYGLPLSATVGLAVVISSSDRFLIAYFMGEAAAGLYSVSVDFTTQSLTLLMMVVNLAMFPLAVRAWEDGGPTAARCQMATNASLLLGIGVPCLAGLIALAPAISNTLLGGNFRDASGWIMPLVACGAFFGALKAFHFDSAFQFAHRTIQQVWIVLAAAVANVVLNLIAIPMLGLLGSAVASIAAYIASIALTILVGRRHFAVPMPVRAVAQTGAAALLMVLPLLPFRHTHSPLMLALLVSGGAAIYGASLVAFNFLDLRSAMSHRLQAQAARFRGGSALALTGDRS